MRSIVRLSLVLCACVLLTAPTFPSDTLYDHEYRDYNVPQTQTGSTQTSSDSSESSASSASSSSSVSSGSGATASGTLIDPLHERRIERSNGFRAQYSTASQARQSFRDFRAKRQHALLLHRATCRSLVRQANALTELSVYLDCYRKELTIQLDILKRELTWVSSAAGLTTPVKTQATTSITQLMEAIETIRQGIDRDVFPTLSALTEAHQNLARQYWAPYRKAMLAAHADILDAWTAYFLVTLAGRSEAETVTECLTRVEADLAMVREGQVYLENKLKFDQVLLRAKSCIAELRSTSIGVRSAGGASASGSENEPEPQETSPRRRSRMP